MQEGDVKCHQRCAAKRCKGGRDYAKNPMGELEFMNRCGRNVPNTYNAGDPSTIMSSGVTIEEVYKEVKKIRADMVRREDLEALADTVEILSNPATMQLIRKSDEDIQCGRVKERSSVDDLLRECS